MEQDNNYIEVSTEDFVSGKADHLIQQLPEISDKQMINVLLARVDMIMEHLGLFCAPAPENTDPTVGNNNENLKW